MYQLNQFCNIISKLRKEKGWTQAVLAEKLGIAPQSISKWECGVGYPDVTLFPVIAELFCVPIGVLFGQSIKESNMNNPVVNKKEFVFDPLHHIEIKVGNTCIVNVIRKDDEHSRLIMEGDTKFVSYMDVEEEEGKLLLHVKNPTGSAKHWIPYDREGFNKDNQITLYTGKEECCIYAINYLDLECCDFNTDDIYLDKWIYRVIG